MSQTHKVLISDNLSHKAADIFKKNGIEVDVNTGLSPEELAKIIGNYDGLAIRSATHVDAALLSQAPRLKVVGRAGIGVDNVDLVKASEHNVLVLNTPFGNSISTAEHTIAMLMSLARHIPQASASTQAGKWEKKLFMGTEIAEKTLGLIGMGNIGSIVADRAQGLKMKVVAYDPFLSSEVANKLNIEKVELNELLEQADFITVHTPLIKETKYILNAKTLAQCKAGVRIINCARGGIVEEKALLDALNSGHVAGAALDVFEEEPAKSNPLFDHKNVIFTPHIAASTAEAQEKVGLQVAEQISAYLNDGKIINPVNTIK